MTKTQDLIDKAWAELEQTKLGYTQLDPKTRPSGRWAKARKLLDQAKAAAGPVYVNPFRHATVLSLERTDQGVDVRFKEGSPIEAIGPAVVTRATRTSGWPLGGCVQLRITEGDHAGEEVYHAEDVIPAVKEGQHVEAGDVVAHAGKQGWSESGFIQPGTHTPCSGDTSGKATAPGKAFARWLRELGFTTKENPGTGSTHGCKS